MANLNDLLQDYVNKSYDELLSFAKISLSHLVDPFTEIFGSQQDAAQVTAFIISACVGVDGKITALEAKFIRDLLGVNEDYTEVIAKMSNEDSRTLTDKIMDSFTGDMKSHMLLFCLSFLAVDETISRDEGAFVRRLLD